MFNSAAINPIIVTSFVLAALVSLLSLAGFFLNRRRFGAAAQVVLPLALVALAGTVATYRFRYAGLWLPPLPDNVGNWKATDTPLSQGTLDILGDPMAHGHEYSNPFNETVYSSVVCAGPFENYHDPTVCVVGSGFTLTAKKTVAMGEGDWKVRAMVFKQNGAADGVRLMMYYWTQTRRNHTSTAAQMGNFRDIGARLQTGYAAVVQGEQNVIVRIYTEIHPDDTGGAQAQRNLDEICRATYRMLAADGAKGTVNQ